MALPIVILSLLLYDSVLASQNCSNISVQWLCESTPMQQKCFDSLDEAVNYIENESLCQSQLRVNVTFISTAVNLSSNATFSNANFSKLSFFGAPNHTQIYCEAGAAALRFDGSYDEKILEVVIRNISFLSCGPGVSVPPAALYFYYRCKIELSDVKVKDSIGNGLVVINVLGGLNVTQSMFTDNKLGSGLGAGVHITLNFSANETDLQTVHVLYNFTHCCFKNNEAITNNNVSNPFVDYDTKGGGLYISFRGYTNKSHVVVQNCSFSDNSAHWGAGLLGKFDDNATNNNLSILSTTFNNNHGNLKIPYVAGAGAMINVYSNSSGNQAHIHNCTFIGNSASWGGGVEFYSKPLHLGGGDNTMMISQCYFSKNFAFNGAAINIYCSSAVTSPENCNVNPVVSDSNFIDNGNFSLVSNLNQIATSIIAISYFPTVLNGTLNFLHNNGSPLHIHETIANLKENTTLYFHNNLAQYGGAISLYGSWITVSNGSKLIFSNNTALNKGGAIYAYPTDEAFMPYVHRCFVRYNNTNPKEAAPWYSTASFHFTDNKPETIYATSLLPCVWNHNDTWTLDQDIRDTFCSWKNWNFTNGNCTNKIRTAARNFSTTPQNVTMFPGIPHKFLRAVDDLGHNVSNFTIIPTVVPTRGQNKYKVQFIDEYLLVFGNVKTNVTILLELEGDRPIFMKVNVSLQDCPPGFNFYSDALSCKCHFSSHFYCQYKTDSHWTANLFIGFCTSYSKIKREYRVVYGRCPFTSGNNRINAFTPYLPLPFEKEKLDEKFCRKLNRTGKLCGRCIKNYSIDVFSDTFDCHNCTGFLKNWLIFATVEGLLPLIFFVMVLLLHISFTSGPLNGFIFYSQVLTVSLEVIVFKSAWMKSSVKHSDTISSTVVSLYSIWSLEFFRLIRVFNEDFRMCLGPQLKVIHVLALHYLSAIYPLCFLLVAYIVIELHARNCRILVWLWKPLCFLCTRFRQAWKAQTSIVDAFAAFILLSYVKVVRISMILLSFSDVYNSNFTVEERVVNYDPTVKYLGSEHAPFAAISAFFFLTFGLIPTLLLTFYQFKIVQKCLNRCKLNRSGLCIFMDAFQGYYKDGKDGGPDCRYFAGLYFFFRLIIFAIFDVAYNLYLTYILLLMICILFGIITAVVQPYKKSFYTYLDIFFFNLLATIMALHVCILLGWVLESRSPTYLLCILLTFSMIPMVYLLGFVFFWLCRRIPKSIKRKILQGIWALCTPFPCLRVRSQRYYNITYSPDDTPDRLINSFRYRKFTWEEGDSFNKFD